MVVVAAANTPVACAAGAEPARRRPLQGTLQVVEAGDRMKPPPAARASASRARWMSASGSTGLDTSSTSKAGAMAAADRKKQSNIAVLGFATRTTRLTSNIITP